MLVDVPVGQKDGTTKLWGVLSLSSWSVTQTYDIILRLRNRQTGKQADKEGGERFSHCSSLCNIVNLMHRLTEGVEPAHAHTLPVPVDPIACLESNQLFTCLIL